MTNYRRNVLFASSAGVLNSISWFFYLPAAIVASGPGYASWLPFLALLQLVPSLDFGVGTNLSRNAAMLDPGSKFKLESLKVAVLLQVVLNVLVGTLVAYVARSDWVFLLLAVFGAILLPPLRLPSAILQGYGRWSVERAGVFVAGTLRLLTSGLVLLGLKADVVYLAAFDLVTLLIPGLIAVVALPTVHRSSSRRRPVPVVYGANMWVWIVGTAPFVFVQLPVLLLAGRASVDVAICLAGLARIAGLVRQAATWITEPAMREIQLRRESCFQRKFLVMMATFACSTFLIGGTLAVFSDEIIQMWLTVAPGAVKVLWMSVVVSVAALVWLQALGVMALTAHREKVLALCMLPALVVAIISELVFEPVLAQLWWAGASLFCAAAGTVSVYVSNRFINWRSRSGWLGVHQRRS